jgi:glycosyltransferase involved in cell wall biosynthesis
MTSEKKIRILIVAEHASARFGGEAILPLHYFRILRERGIEAWMIVHERTRTELEALLPKEADRISYIRDNWINILSWRTGKILPARLAYLTVGFISRLSTQISARRLARRLVAREAVDVIHQPIPVSPREPSLIYDMGAPVVFGPMNGNMTYPPAFQRSGAFPLATNALLAAARRASAVMHWLMPGKLRARALLVANERTRKALPSAAEAEIFMLPENGVDLSLWYPAAASARQRGMAFRLVFVGRMVDWKAVDILIDAISLLDPTLPVTLDLVGDGDKRSALEAQVHSLGLGDKVCFRGWMNQKECAEILRNSDVMVLPSLFECGGAVVLEAMASGIPVIATDWGGPADYIDARCGIMVEPSSREAIVSGIRDAISRLATDPEHCIQLGLGAQERAREFDWEQKVDAILDIYESARH